MSIAPKEAARIEAAVAAAQARTRGEIVCVLARASSTYETAPLIASILIGLAAPWPLLLLTEWSAERIFVIQLVVFLAVLTLLSLTPLGVALTSRSSRRASAHRAALGQFMVRGLARNRERNGVLIYVSLAEQYGRIIADEGAAASVGQNQWQAVVDEMLAGIKRGATANALIGAASHCADLLAPAYPPEPAGAEKPPRRHFHMV